MTSVVISIIIIITWILNTDFLDFSSDTVENREAVELVRVIDGDTIVYQKNDQNYTLRLLLVDTPESSTTKTGEAQPFGLEAKEYLKDILADETLHIEYEPVQEKTDKYGRELAYLFAGDIFVQKLLLEEGYARLAYESGEEKYFEILQKSETQANEDDKNIWGIKNYVEEYGFRP